MGRVSICIKRDRSDGSVPPDDTILGCLKKKKECSRWVEENLLALFRLDSPFVSFLHESAEHVYVQLNRLSLSRSYQIKNVSSLSSYVL